MWGGHHSHIYSRQGMRIIYINVDIKVKAIESTKRSFLFIPCLLAVLFNFIQVFSHKNEDCWPTILSTVQKYVIYGDFWPERHCDEGYQYFCHIQYNMKMIIRRDLLILSPLPCLYLLPPFNIQRYLYTEWVTEIFGTERLTKNYAVHAEC